MSNSVRLAILENRYNTLSGRGVKNVKSSGVLRKLSRQIRNLKEDVK